MSRIKIWVAGTPAPQGSKTRNRYGAVYESSKAVAPWRDAVRTETQRAVGTPFTGPVKLLLVFYLRRPKGHFRTGRNAHLLRDAAPAAPSGAPDLDKLCRAVLDGLTDGGAWKDDGQVQQMTAEKWYDPAGAGGCMIVIEGET